MPLPAPWPRDLEAGPDDASGPWIRLHTLEAYMADLLSLMKWPLIASLILPWLLVYLGLHIVERGVIFVDLALAQTAAFGTCISLMLGYDVHDWQSYAF